MDKLTIFGRLVVYTLIGAAILMILAVLLSCRTVVPTESHATVIRGTVKVADELKEAAKTDRVAAIAESQLRQCAGALSQSDITVQRLVAENKSLQESLNKTWFELRECEQDLNASTGSWWSRFTGAIGGFFNKVAWAIFGFIAGYIFKTFQSIILGFIR